MKKTEQDPLRKFKAEADENLFEDLHFDSRLKERVMQTAHKESKRFSLGNWLQVNRRKWAMGTATAAVIISVMVFSSSMFQNDITLPPDSEEGDIMGTPFIVNEPLIEGDVDPGLSQTETRILNDFDEAKAWFGEALLLSGYEPEKFILKEISGSGELEGSADLITYEYVKESTSYYVVQHKVGSSSMIQHGEEVDINGHTGFLSDDDTTVLHWFADEVQYVVSGTISKEEVLQVARSLY